jgi:hypothetical protein
MKRNIFLATTLAILLSAWVLPVFAVPSGTVRPTNSVRPSVTSKARNTVCAKVQAGILQIQAKVEQNKDTHIKRYTLMLDKVDTLVERLEAKGYNINTDNFELARADLEAKIDEMETYYDEFVSELKEAEDFACEGNMEQYRNQLGESRESLRELRNAAQEAFQIMKSGVKDALVDIKNQLRNQVPTTGVPTVEPSEAE